MQVLVDTDYLIEVEKGGSRAAESAGDDLDYAYEFIRGGSDYA
jgi:hypothetical protein